MPDTPDFVLEPSDPAAWRIGPDRVTATAPPRTDLFIDPSGTSGVAAESMLNAVTALGDPGRGDVVLSARVSVDFRDTFDAGVLLVWIDEGRWAKLCFERSPAGEHLVVSVVTRGTSDDANGEVVDGDSVWLRVSRVGRMFAFHASTDGRTWRFARAFTFDTDEPARIGFEAQSPVGDGCEVAFDDLRFERRTLADLRDGS
ncbi:DUF1349 domain-containing protein [Leifsonia shinshuensis]|uniref:DUF1349 domain-containing protein n=1 Tax=Leifsonia shinshuensis TaxID=150026 RepID=UPI001F50ECB6|nr:DUF1349 domain-containing protein [Leifsonia shinshuensis]MCI0158372.1 DUF1349 domain-containing protein [Leifsonia shinshuensis]